MVQTWRGRNFMDAYSSLIVQMSNDRLSDLRRETAGRPAWTVARIRLRRRARPVEAPVALPGPVLGCCA
jgi:hypothetical protein